ncbi:MarR family transcriptional regulator [Mucilaginibacter sp. UR6-1]|uniref:MarR family winged helix-turn-helix transcriptional regulator n=1 Tax=Mucilaginibacter sp. UR6-1 TaxID=1435643 RepID=UPI001E3E1347|nr:MarR family transcriptional regulator [Mucilaginibacter sp. UR6-1]MCC8410506.1 MarR family transcriptional regulator [Mucilaginibacter sp. UR6-1]
MSNNTKQLASQLRETTTRLIKKLRKKSSTGEKLSLTERSTIALLDQHRQLLPSELAAMEKITTQSMSQILNHLFELGYINREPSQTDKRKVIISLSDHGREVLYRVRNERDEWLYIAISDLCPPEEQELLNRALDTLKKIIEHE